MLYWICPECGGECSPAVRECPACAGPAVTSPASASPAYRKPAVTQEVLALVQNLQSAPSLPLPKLNGLAAGNGHSASTAILELPDPPREAIESLVRPLVESTALAPPPPETPVEKAPIEKAIALAEPEPEPPAISAVRGIVASFKGSQTNLLAPPPEVVTAPAPPCLQWMRIPRPRLSPVAPKDVNPGDLMSGLQTPPLAGPVVPQQLRNLTEQHAATRGQARKKAALPAWTVSFLVALTLFLGVGTLLQYLAANRDAKAAAPTAAPSDQSSSPVSTSEQPASKLVEVTGLRVASSPNRKPQLAFIVVNHSGNQLSGVGLQIAVRSATSSAGVAPLFRITTTIPALGPYQSREFRADLDPELHATDLPDWQSLRADVRVNTQ
jgi:hypothetical protein